MQRLLPVVLSVEVAGDVRWGRVSHEISVVVAPNWLGSEIQGTDGTMMNGHVMFCDTVSQFVDPACQYVRNCFLLVLQHNQWNLMSMALVRLGWMMLAMTLSAVEYCRFGWASVVVDVPVPLIGDGVGWLFLH